MRAKAKLKMAAGLIEVQNAQRVSAEVAMTAARSAHETAQREEQEAREESRLAFDEWLAGLTRPTLFLELSQFLSRRLIEREHEAGAATTRSHIMADISARRERDWQEAEARTRSSEAAFRKLRRTVRRRAEEDALNRSADLVTYAWRRP